MPTPISYLSGNTLSYQSGMVKKGTIGLNLTSSLTGNYKWWNGVDATSSQYLIYSDTYSTGASSEANVTPAAWSTPDLTDQSLLNLINTLPDRVGQTAFTTLSNALIWLNESGKYFVVRNGYENIVTSGLTLNLDAAWSNSFTTGSTFWYDLSGTGNTGTLTNGPSFTTQDGGAIVFDGTNDVVRVSQQGNSLKPTYFTTEAWVKLNSSQSSRIFIATFSESQSGIGMGLCDPGLGPGTNNTIKFFTSGNGSVGYDHIYSTFQINVGQWYHVVCTYDGSFKRIYINGILNNSSAYTQTIGYTNNDFTVGGLDYNGSIIQSFDGNIAYARMYNRALSQSEILQNYHVTKQRFGFNNIVGNGLVLNLNSQNTISYPTSGTSWYDLTGNNNTGTLTNGPTFDSTTRSIVFDGVDDYVTTSGNVGISGATARTLECWYYSDSTSNKSILGYGGNNQSKLFDTMTWNNGQNIIGHYYGGNYDTISTLPSRVTINQNKWNHIIHMYDGTNVSIYTNGVFSNSKEFSISGGNQLNTDNSTFRIGTGQYTGGYQYATGKISNAKIYNKVLSQSEILQNYYQGNIVTNGLIMNLDAGNLVSYGGTGTIWGDLTNTTTGATLVNGPTYTTSNGGGIVFDGSDDYGRLPSTSSVDVNTFTWSAFVKGVYSNTPGLFFIGSDVGQSISPYKIFIGVQNAGGVYKLRVNYNNVATVNLGSLVDNTLYNLVITYNGTTTNMYVNGELIGTSNAMSGNLTSKTYTYIASTQGQYEFFNGTVYNTLFYNRALSQSEIIQNFNAHKSRYGL